MCRPDLVVAQGDMRVCRLPEMVEQLRVGDVEHDRGGMQLDSILQRRNERADHRAAT